METTSLVQPEILKSFKSVKRTLYNNNNYYYHIHHPDPQIKKIRKSHKLSFEHGNLLKSAIHVTEVSTITVPESSRNLVKLPTVPAYQPTDYNSSAKNFSTAGIMENLSNRSGSSMQCSTWKIYRVISNHLGCVRCVAFDPSNKWFCTGSADRTIKIWDVASGRIKHTLTGHIGQVRSVAVSDRHTYMFSAGDDKQVKCWDLEHNKVTRSFYGHLSGVYCLALHPSIDVLITGGRDSVGRVWDIRTKKQIFALSGHDNTVCSVFARSSDPQVVTGSHDTTVKFWDLRSGKTMETLTHHKKSVRTLVHHPVENNFVSAAADNVKKFNLPKGELMHNMVSEQKTIINAMAVNRDGVLVAGGDDGSMSFWDWKTGQKFQRIHTTAQPGSLDCEAAIYAAAFDVTGSRLVTCEADKTVKMWKQNTK